MNNSTETLRDSVQALSINRNATYASSLTVGEVIRERRTELRMSQSDVAKLIKTKAPEYIGMIENGTRSLELNKIPSLARALKLNEQDLTKLALYNAHPEAYKALHRAGEPIPSSVQKNKENQSHVLQISREDLELVQMFNTLDPGKRTAIVTLIQSDASSYLKSQKNLKGVAVAV